MVLAQPLFHIAIGSRFENIELVQVILADSLGRLGLEGDASHWIDIAVREAVANAIKHGNQQDPDKRVEVDARVEQDSLVIQVEDQGSGFEPEEVANPLDPANLLRPSGRGIFYMRRFMDDVQYRPRQGGGTVVTLTKRMGSPVA